MQCNDRIYHVKPDCNRLEEGFVTPEIGISGICCPECGVWTGMRRVPQLCPARISEWLKTRIDGPMTVAEWQELNEIWQLCRNQGSPEKLLPGDAFSPVQWRSNCSESKTLYWPQYSSVVSEISVFNAVQKLSDQCLVPVKVIIQGGATSFVEWSFAYHSNVVAQCVSDNVVKNCKDCGRRVVKYSERYERELRTQEEGKWIFKDNCLDRDVFLSHIFYPGFLARQSITNILKSSNLAGTVIEEIDIRNRC